MALIQLILYLVTSPKNHSGQLAAKCPRRMYNGQEFNGISGEKLVSPKSDIKPFQSERIKLILKSTHKLTILSRGVTVEQSFCLFPGNISSMKSASTSDKHSLLSMVTDSESLMVKAQWMLFMRQSNFVTFNSTASFQNNYNVGTAQV